VEENATIEVCSNDGTGFVRQEGVAESTPAAVAVLDVDLYECADGWESGRFGERVGTLHASCITLPNGRGVWHLMFDLEGGRYGNGTIVASGVLPILPDGPGAGRIPVTGSAGVGKRRSVTIEVVNPKRYLIEA
jgi:hypothetical protein